MRRSVVLVAFLAVSLPACTNGTASVAGTATTNTTAAAVDTSVPGTSTTAPAAEPTGADEQLVPCDNQVFRAAFGTKMSMGLCTATWATGNTDKDTWNCPDAGCRQVNLFHKTDTWVKTVVCDTTVPLTYWKGSCFKPDMSAVTAADIPPASIQCRIWPANASFTFIAETGCDINEDVIAAATSGECTHWSNNPILPLVKCDSGDGVTAAQKALKKAGFGSQTDGFMGPATVKSVVAYQKAKNLKVSAMVDLPTWQSLFPGNAGLPGGDLNGDGTITPDEF